MSTLGVSVKITGEHLERLAIVYVRQSTLAQVRDHGVEDVGNASQAHNTPVRRAP